MYTSFHGLRKDSWICKFCGSSTIVCRIWQQGKVRFMVFNATFNNISVISWQSVLLVEETRVPRENHQPVTKFITTYTISAYHH